MNEKTIYALGFFDGVHLGHQALLSACRALAEETGANVGAVTFDGHPQALLTGRAPALINSIPDRCRLLRQYGAARIVTLPFDEKMRKMPWQDFFLLLTERYGAAGFVCGRDFRFGYRGEGNAEKLRAICHARNLPCTVVEDQFLDGVRISSTHIRSLIEAGQMADAVRFLGHGHILSATVVTGRRLGRTLGIPTANVLIPEGLVMPRFGVYACRVQVNGKQYAAVTNVGNRPTVGGHRITVEPWILDFDGDLYGQELQLAFFTFLRPEEKFPSLEDLRAAIQKNADETRNFFKNM